jgi:hypothetical protein
MSVTVSPDEFRYVMYDAAEIRRVAEGLAGAIGFDDRPVHIEIDETTPLARVSADIGDTVVVHAESGAFEDTRRPRRFSETAAATSLGRILLRVHDRLHGGFADAPADETLTLAQMAAWEAYSVGRIERLGVTVNQQRWRYNFRNRHGFNDRVDAVFDRIWASDGLTWPDLDALSREAAA